MATPYREKIKQQPRKTPILLFILPLPLIVTLLFSLVQNRFFSFAISLLGVGLYLLAAYFLARANYYEAQAKKRKWKQPNKTPWRLTAAAFSAIATGIVALFIVKHSLLIALGYALVAFMGIVFYYGLDARHAQRTVNLGGVNSEELSDIFDEAEAKIASIRQAAKKVKRNDAALAKRLEHIADGSQGILDIIADDPKDLRRARKFLKVYLEGAQKVIQQYGARQHLQDDKTIETNLSNVLNSIDSVIEEQHLKLLENDILELDVQIEVLQTQLKHEGTT